MTSIPTESHRRSAESLRLTGEAALNGNPIAREILTKFSTLTKEPHIAGEAKRYLRQISAAEVISPCDTGDAE